MSDMNKMDSSENIKTPKVIETQASKHAVSDALHRAESVISDATDTSKYTVSDAVHKAEKAITEATASTKHTVSDAVHTMENVVSDVVDKAVEITTAVATKASHMFQGADKKIDETGPKVNTSVA